MSAREKAKLDAALKAAFDARAAEPAPDHLIRLAVDLSTEPKKRA